MLITGNDFQKSIISMLEVDQQNSSPGFYIFDVTSEAHYRKVHVKNAVYLPRDFHSFNLPPDRNATIVFYTKNNKSRVADEAARRAFQFGYKKIYVMRAGIDGWIQSGRPVRTLTAFRQRAMIGY